MLIGRTQEMEKLEKLYAADRSGIMIVYGRRGIGKTALILQFLMEKQSLFYAVRRVTGREQMNCIKREWKLPAETESLYDALSQKYREALSSKLVIVFDEFRGLMEETNTFLTDILRFYMEHYEEKRLLLVLSSSSIHYVENEMTKDFSVAARLISGFVKLKEFSFMEHAKYHRQSSLNENIICHAVLGGVPAYLRLWNEKKSERENITRLFLSENAPLFSEAEFYLKQELRELSAYQTILAALAAGQYRLNELFLYTGFSRAKISVYLKNLSDRNITEKLFSEELPGVQGTERGLFKIREPYLCFWFRFIYPNLSKIAAGEGGQVFDESIGPYLSEFCRDVFQAICEEYLLVLSSSGDLLDEFGSFGSYFGKNGRVDILSKGKKGAFLAGFCFTGDRREEEAYFDRCMERLKEYHFSPQKIYFFSLNGFQREKTDSEPHDRIVRISAQDM